MDGQSRLHPILEIAKEESYQRQKLPKVYQLNGAIYIASTDFLQVKKDFVDDGTIGYVMPRERSCDIDTMMDFYVAELLLKKCQLEL